MQVRYGIQKYTEVYADFKPAENVAKSLRKKVQEQNMKNGVKALPVPTNSTGMCNTFFCVFCL